MLELRVWGWKGIIDCIWSPCSCHIAPTRWLTGKSLQRKIQAHWAEPQLSVIGLHSITTTPISSILNITKDTKVRNPSIILPIKSLDIANSSWDDEPNFCHELVLNCVRTNLPRFLFPVRFCATKLGVLNSNRVLGMPSTRKSLPVLWYTFLLIEYFLQSRRWDFHAWATWLNQHQSLRTCSTAAEMNFCKKSSPSDIESQQIRQRDWQRPCEEKKRSEKWDSGYAANVRESFGRAVVQYRGRKGYILRAIIITHS